MVNYKDILRLNSQAHSQRQIAKSVHCSRDTVSAVLVAAKAVGLSWPLDDNTSSQDIQALLFPERQKSVSTYQEPNYAHIHKELSHHNVTLTLLWSEYCATCHNTGTTPYMYTQFCEKYRRWARITKATMRITHKPGEAMQVDWAGTTIPYFDSITGDESAAYIFVAVLPCSCYAYVEACNDMKSENWLICHAHAYNYFGGVTRLLIPDNLKTGVTKNTRYETQINRSYQELATHYNTAIVPARVRKPQDKSMAEGTVKFASTWIVAAMRNQKFFTIQEVQRAVSEKLDELNDRPFQKREGSRKRAYLEEEQSFMLPLPATRYEPAIWTQATIGSDYLVTDGKNKYSVPFDLIGEQVQVRLTRDIIEIFLRGGRVASHPRKFVAQRDPIILQTHMPDQHRKYLNYNSDDFTKWSTSIGDKTTAVIQCFLTVGTVPEQGYKACASLTKLAERYGKERLEHACGQALAYAATPTIRLIGTLLKNKQETRLEKPTSEPTNTYAITRGAAYYSKGGGSK